MSSKVESLHPCAGEAVYLMACALQGARPVLDGLEDLETLYRFCQFHHITAMVAMALEDGWKAVAPEDPQVMQPWRQARDKAIRKNMLLNAERERLLNHLESIGCWYMPLKGSLLQYDYPKFGMRQMSDNDILCDPAFQREIRAYMEANGYKVEMYGKGNHDEYLKPPVYNFEIHNFLFHKSNAPAAAAYYANLQNRLVRDQGNGYGYHFAPADFYIYMLAHAYKHVEFGGTGLRTLADVYVYLRRHSPEIDWDYAERELKAQALWEFHLECAGLGQKLFAEPSRELALSDAEGAAFQEFARSGVYGTEQQRVERKLSQLQPEGERISLGTKLRYLLRRLFPPVAVLYVEYPMAEKQKWLIPYAWVSRLFRGITRKPEKVIKELQMLKNKEEK